MTIVSDLCILVLCILEYESYININNKCTLIFNTVELNTLVIILEFLASLMYIYL